MSQWRLEPAGTIAWSDLINRVPDGLTWCWVDLDGYGVGEPPIKAPLGTHVWAWSDQAWVRGRVERGQVRTAILRRASDGPGEPAPVRESPGLPWKDNESRLSQAGRDTMGRFGGLGTPYILTAGVEAPITFLHYGSAAPGDSR